MEISDLLFQIESKAESLIVLPNDLKSDSKKTRKAAQKRLNHVFGSLNSLRDKYYELLQNSTYDLYETLIEFSQNFGYSLEEYNYVRASKLAEELTRDINIEKQNMFY